MLLYYVLTFSRVGCLAQEFRGLRRPALGERQELLAEVSSKGPELLGFLELGFWGFWGLRSHNSDMPGEVHGTRSA